MDEIVCRWLYDACMSSNYSVLVLLLSFPTVQFDHLQLFLDKVDKFLDDVSSMTSIQHFCL